MERNFIKEFIIVSLYFYIHKQYIYIHEQDTHGPNRFEWNKGKSKNPKGWEH